MAAVGDDAKRRAQPARVLDRIRDGNHAVARAGQDEARAAHPVEVDPRVDLDRVRCPCLVLAGARDRMVPVADAIEYARRLRAPLRIVPDCGHLLIGERPEACADAIGAFLHRHGA